MKNHLIFSLIVVLLLFCGCGSDDSSGNGGGFVLPESGEDVSGVWRGLAHYQKLNGEEIELQINFEFVQNGQNITGSCEFTHKGDSISIEDVSGTINNAFMTTSVMLRRNNGETLAEYVFEGDVNENVFAGDLTISGTDDDGIERSVTGTFTVTKAEGAPLSNN